MSSSLGRGRGSTAPSNHVQLVQELGNLTMTNGGPKTTIAPKIAPGKRSCATAKVATNIYGIIPPKNRPAYRYDYRVNATFGTAAKELTKQSREDYISIDRKTKCTIVFKFLVKKYGDFFGRLTDNVYDRASIIYRLSKLKFDDGTQERTFTIAPAEFPEDLGLDEKCTSLIVKIKPVDEDFELIIDDLASAVTNRLDDTDRSIRQFYELLISQSAFFRPEVFVSYGNGQSYLLDHRSANFDDRDIPQLPEGKYIAIGSDKSVRAIEGPQGQGHVNMSFAIDIKKNAFHAVERVSEKIANICGTALNPNFSLDSHQMASMKPQLKGLFVETLYGKVRKFQIAGLSKELTARLSFVDKNGQKVTIQKYFKDAYNISLQYLNLPCILERRPARPNQTGGVSSNQFSMYPAEQVRICDNQRVTMTQQTPKQMEAMIKACAVPPAQRKEQIDKNMVALQLSDGGKQNEWLANMQIRITPKPLSLNARQLPAPTAEYGNGIKVNISSDTANWRADRTRYYQPADCSAWAMYALNIRNDRFGLQSNDLSSLLERFMSQASTKGMRLAKPFECTMVDGSEQTIVRIFEAAHKNKLQFIFFIQADRLSLHGTIKLCEANFQIISQDLKMGTAGKVVRQGQVQTLENIVNKTNMKLGGLNYNILLENPTAQKWISNGNRLFLGLDVSHPAPLKKYQIEKGEKPRVPSVVGYAANTNRNPIEFVGDYKFQESRQEAMITTLSDIGKTVVQSYEKSRGQRPDHIVVIRNGVSDGQYKMVMHDEVAELKRGFQLVGDKYRPKLTLIVVQKQHNIRIMPEIVNPGARPADQNIKPGTVIDQYIVNPGSTEFYLNSHRANQGTAKTPRYTVLVDEAGLSADELQGMLYAQCFNHQIVNMSISTPVSVYIAGLYAGRGRMNFLAKYGDDDSSGSNTDHGLDYVQLNKELSYAGKALAMVRFNA